MTIAHEQVQIKQWYGPQPTDLQRLLLAACIENLGPGVPTELPLARALRAWHQWLQQCNFDLEDSASLELASLAVSRLGTNLQDSTEIQRCKGWRRREWIVSELAVEALRRIEKECRNRSLTAIAFGDVATAQSAARFAGQPFAIRSIELSIPRASKNDRVALDQAARSGPAANAFKSNTLKLVIYPRVPWRGEISVSPFKEVDSPSHAIPSVLVPSIPEQIALLATSNWQRRKYGTLRWIPEILSLVETFSSTADLAETLTAIAYRDGTASSLQSALNCIASLPGTLAIGPLAASANSMRKSGISTLRNWRRTTRLEPGWSQFKYFIKRQLLSMNSHPPSKEPTQ